MGSMTRSWEKPVLLLHVVNAIGVSLFVGAMLNLTILDSWPVYGWDEFFRRLVSDALPLIPVIFALDAMPALVLRKFSAGPAWHASWLRLPFLNALLFGLIAVCANLYDISNRFYGDPFWQVVEELRFGFLLHFVPLFPFECITRFIYLRLVR